MLGGIIIQMGKPPRTAEPASHMLIIPPSGYHCLLRPRRRVPLEVHQEEGHQGPRSIQRV